MSRLFQYATSTDPEVIAAIERTDRAAAIAWVMPIVAAVLASAITSAEGAIARAERQAR